jgi:signal transduction histidine kinase
VFVAIINDITDRVRTEAELREREERLKQALESVRQAKDAAERANHAKSEFLAAMSHELRTPLNAIAGYLDLLDIGVHGAITEVQRHSLQRIKRNQEYLLRLINDILHFAKIEAGHLEFDLTPFSVVDVLRTVEPLMKPQAQARGLRYVSRAGDALVAKADAERVQQILLNLIGNAIKFTEEGGTVTVSARANREHIEVRVEDTGLGIPGDQLEAVFDPFFQVRPGRYETNQQGVGLGLAISRDLARSMGGDVTVQSEVGRGSRFTLQLPRA